MKLNNNAKVFYKDGDEKYLAKTTDLCFSAHQDDIEIMAYGPIAKCYRDKDNWFTGVVITDGAGSPRSGIYENYTNDEMKLIRIEEQRNAGVVGEYAATILLGYPSSVVKGKEKSDIKEDIKAIIREAKPETIYVHNLADKHATHVACAVTVLDAIRELEKEYRPNKILGLEVWRGLDWMVDSEKVCLDTSKYPNVEAAVLGVYDSQISGGKRYDLAAVGRRLANATFFESHDVDDMTSMSYAMDLTPLMESNISYTEYVNKYIESFKTNVNDMIDKFV